jgi:hypothetical protein
MVGFASLWYFEPKYHRLATHEGDLDAEFGTRRFNQEILFYAELVPREDCLWVYFPESPSITRFWRNADVAEIIATQNPDLIIFFAELMTPENDP